MSTRVRFVRALDVFEAFPELARYAPAPLDDVAPLDFARALLASRRKIDALSFIAHMLPRREAVWWARQCLAAILGAAMEDDAARAAEAWVRNPEETTRRVALDLAARSDPKRPTTWLARAAGWSGGSVIAPEHTTVPPAPDACAQAAAAAVTLAIVAQPPMTIPLWIDACAAGGLRFADGGEARIEPIAQSDFPVGTKARGA